MIWSRTPQKVATNRVAIVEPVGGHGGMDYYDLALCSSLRRAGAAPHLYTSAETMVVPDVEELVHRYYVGVFGRTHPIRRGLRYASATVRSLIHARYHNVRLVHFHFFHVGALEIYNLVLAKALGFRVMATAHDVSSFANEGAPDVAVRRAYALCDGIIVHSRAALSELQSRLGITPERITHVPHGNYAGFTPAQVPERKDARKRLGLPERAHVLLFFGQIKKVKGLDVLLDAMPGVLRQHPDTVLIIAGKQWKVDFAQYEQRISQLGIDGSVVRHIRYIPDEMVADYYSASTLVVLPYRQIYQSGVLLMAMSYQRPVLVSDVPGMTEIVNDGDNGYTFHSEDSTSLATRLIDLLRSPAELSMTAQRAHKYVLEKHSWASVASKTILAYRAATGDAAPPMGSAEGGHVP